MPVIASSYSDSARSTLAIAQDEARKNHHEKIQTEDLLLALLSQPETVACQALQRHFIGYDPVKAKVETNNTANRDTAGLTPRSQNVLQYAHNQAARHGCEQVEPHHILLGILCEKDCVAAEIIASIPVSHSELRRTVLELMRPCDADEAEILLTISGQEVVLSDELAQLLKNAIWSSCGSLSTKGLLKQIAEEL